MIGEYQTVIHELEDLARDRGLAFDPVVFQITDSDEIAEVLGHADFFANNHWYRKSNKNMLNLAEQHARMIRSFEVRYGRERVEKLLDALLTVATSVNAFERSGPELKKRLIYYLEERAPLEDFERILLESIREEAEYFDLIQRTHIINEGWATFVEAELLNRLLTAKEWATISVQLSNRPAPYTIGYTFFASLRDQAGFDRVLEIRRFYEDVSLIDLVLTDELVRRLDIFVYDTKEKQKSYDTQKVKAMLIAQKLYKGEPRIEVDATSQGRDLLLAHLDEDRKLEPKRVNLFLRAVYCLWRNPAKLRANGKVYTSDRRRLSSTYPRRPSRST